MAKIIDNIYKLLCFIMVVCLSLMTLMVFLNTALRYTFETSIISSEELSRFMFIWLTFCGGVVAMADDLHIKVDILITRLPKAAARVVDVAVNVIMAGICAILAYGGWVQTGLNLTNYAPATHVPLGYVFSSVVLSGVGMVLICLARAAKAVFPLTAREEGGGK
jgi:TRAP-type C4-dicarboxylate transport system permease small subunit